MSVLLFDVFNGCSTSIKEMVNMERNVKHLLLRKTDVLKTCGEKNFLERKVEELHQL